MSDGRKRGRPKKGEERTHVAFVSSGEVEREFDEAGPQELEDRVRINVDPNERDSDPPDNWVGMDWED